MKTKTVKCRECHRPMVVIAHYCDDICDSCYYPRQSMTMTSLYPWKRGEPSELIGLGKDNRNKHLIEQICDALRGEICIVCGDPYDIQGGAHRVADALIIRLVCQCHESHNGYALFDERNMSLCAVYSNFTAPVEWYGASSISLRRP